MRSRGKPASQIRIAKERIAILFDEAKKAKTRERANRYAQLARKIGMRYNVRLLREQRRQVCRHCKAYLPKASQCRLKSGCISIKCLSCNKINRYPYRVRQ